MQNTKATQRHNHPQQENQSTVGEQRHNRSAKVVGEAFDVNQNDVRDQPQQDNQSKLEEQPHEDSAKVVGESFRVNENDVRNQDRVAMKLRRLDRGPTPKTRSDRATPAMNLARKIEQISGTVLPLVTGSPEVAAPSIGPYAPTSIPSRKKGARCGERLLLNPNRLSAPSS
jgi:hypothetical protein